MVFLMVLTTGQRSNSGQAAIPEEFPHGNDFWVENVGE
jgi:hypothetical protein